MLSPKKMGKLAANQQMLQEPRNEQHRCCWFSDRVLGVSREEAAKVEELDKNHVRISLVPHRSFPSSKEVGFLRQELPYNMAEETHQGFLPPD